ncbi:MaoC family dehydratase [Nocardia sp. NPDC057227]|uniref:MaoC family dehydratase n=1 Tax=Nocardia sp. NPDC057227 TaxID=3346056 RepID=UPI0036333DFF
MRVFRSLDTLRSAVGTVIGPGEWLTVDQDRIDTFAAATGDDQWIHVDPARAATGPYGGTIAHGYLTLSLLPLLGRDLFSLQFGSARINYGSNSVRFPAPVRAGTRIRASAVVTEVEAGEGRVMLTFRWTVENEGNAKPACVAETRTLVLL